MSEVLIYENVYSLRYDSSASQSVVATSINYGDIQLPDKFKLEIPFNLKEIFPNFQQLTLFDANLDFLPDLPDGLISLNCSDNCLEALPSLPNSLQR
jgi:hypothetical protein